MEVFTGHVPRGRLLRALPMVQYRNDVSDSELEVQRLIEISSLHETPACMHREVGSHSAKARKRQIWQHNRGTHVHSAHFVHGDFVLGMCAMGGRHKLSFAWQGQRRVTQVRSEWICEVENIITGKREVVHSRRLRLYRADMEREEVNPALLKAAEHSEWDYQIAEKFHDIREVGGSIQILIEREGLPDECDWTWESI